MFQQSENVLSCLFFMPHETIKNENKHFQKVTSFEQRTTARGFFFLFCHIRSEGFSKINYANMVLLLDLTGKAVGYSFPLSQKKFRNMTEKLTSFLYHLFSEKNKMFPALMCQETTCQISARKIQDLTILYSYLCFCLTLDGCPSHSLQCDSCSSSKDSLPNILNAKNSLPMT